MSVPGEESDRGSTAGLEELGKRLIEGEFQQYRHCHPIRVRLADPSQAMATLNLRCLEA